MLLFLILFTAAYSATCTGVDDNSQSFCDGKDETDCKFFDSQCVWTDDSIETADTAGMWFLNPTNANGYRYKANNAKLGDICERVCGRNCTSTGRINATELTEPEKLDEFGHENTVYPPFEYIAEIECKYLDDGCHGGMSCSSEKTPEECADSQSDCFWIGDHPFAADTGCEEASNSSAGYVFIIMGVALVAMAVMICMDSEIQEAIFEKKVKTVVVLINHVMFNFSSCYALYSALQVMANLSCLNDALEGFTFTDCNDKLDDIALGALLVFIGSVMSLLMLLILSGLHKFGFEDLLDKEETSLSVVCLEACGKHSSKFFMFIGCFVGMKAAKDDGFWGTGCQGDFQEAVDEEYKRFFDALMVALAAMVYDILYFVKELYFPDVELSCSCFGGDEEVKENDVEWKETEAQTTFEITKSPLELAE